MRRLSAGKRTNDSSQEASEGLVNDTTQGASEGLRVTINTVVQGVATGVIDVGEHTPIIAPIFVALRCGLYVWRPLRERT